MTAQRPVVKVVEYLISTVLFGLVIQVPLRQLVFDTVVNHLRHLSQESGRLDIVVFQNQPKAEPKASSRVVLFKSENGGGIEVSKAFVAGDRWLSSLETISVAPTVGGSHLVASASLPPAGVFCLVSGGDAIPRINGEYPSEPRSLLLLTKSEYYRANFENVVGVSAGLGFLVWLSISTVKASRKIGEKEPSPPSLFTYTTTVPGGATRPGRGAAQPRTRC